MFSAQELGFALSFHVFAFGLLLILFFRAYASFTLEKLSPTPDRDLFLGIETGELAQVSRVVG